MDYDRQELNDAILVHERAKEELLKARNAVRACGEKDSNMAASIKAMDRDALALQCESIDDEMKQLNADKSAAKKDERIAAAVVRVASENVAIAAANLLRTALDGNKKMMETPTHFKKFKAFVEDVLGDKFYTQTVGAFNVCYSGGEHEHNTAYVCGLDCPSGTLVFTKEPSHRFVANYEQILEEVKRAVAYYHQLDAALSELRDQAMAEKGTYKTPAKGLVPGVFLKAMYSPFNFDR